MNIWKKSTLVLSMIVLACAVIGTAVLAGGPPLKDNACSICHQDYGKIMPKEHQAVGKGLACMTCHAPNPAKNGATKFSAGVHAIHQGGKTKLECSSCHAQ